MYWRWTYGASGKTRNGELRLRSTTAAVTDAAAAVAAQATSAASHSSRLLATARSLTGTVAAQTAAAACDYKLHLLLLTLNWSRLPTNTIHSLHTKLQVTLIITIILC